MFESQSLGTYGHLKNWGCGCNNCLVFYYI